MPRRVVYAQLALADCGHTITVWPQVRSNGVDFSICEDCTKEKYGVPTYLDAVAFVWVGVTKKIGVDPNTPPPEVIYRKRPKAKPKQPSGILGELYKQAGLF